MQRLGQIKDILRQAGISPRRQLGQNFLIDGNLMARLLELADLTGDQTVLEVGAGSGSLTEELCDRAARVVAVEIDRSLADILRKRLAAQEKLTLICGDILAGKHRIRPAVLAELGASAHLVSNLPYNIATPLVAECLLESWRAAKRRDQSRCLFERLSFTVQREVAEKLCGPAGGKNYGPVSVLVALLGKARLGPRVPAEAFWPRPNVVSRMVRIDFDRQSAGRLADAETLMSVLRMGFGHRRKQIHSAGRRRGSPYDQKAFHQALAAARIAPEARAEQISPEQYLILANQLSRL